MIDCPRCGQDNPPQARFCMGCGNHLGAACARCDAELPPDARYCSRCGAATPAPAERKGLAAPGAPTPSHLAQKILLSRALMEGERKHITVLFADLKGSLELLAERDPEDARRLLDPVLERMIAAVHRYEGTVNQIMGDGIMALFGAPVAHEDHALRACCAALAMQRALASDSGIPTVGGVRPRLRVGINSGQVVVRAIRNDLTMDYTAVGATTHLAARMEQTATPGTVRLTAHTARLIEGFADLVPFGPIAVKGLDHPVEVFELAGVSEGRRRFEIILQRGLGRLVGREHELERLEAALLAVRAGRGHVVAIAGEPGVGKSRLCWEFLRSPATADCLVLEGSCTSYGAATPYAPIAQALRQYCAIVPGADATSIRASVRAAMARLAEPEETDPLLLAVLGEHDPAGTPSIAEARDRRTRTFDAIKRVLALEAARRPVVLAIEDLHWVDAETRELLGDIRGLLVDTRIMLLLNFRQEYRLRWGARTPTTELHLEPLSTANAEQLLDEWLGTSVELADLKRHLSARTGGNPFLLEELVRSLKQTGVLTGVPGNYALTGPYAHLHVPDSVQPVLAARIDRLPPLSKRLLQLAAVIGKDVSAELLRDVCGLTDPDLRDAMGELQDSEFLVEARVSPTVEYTFRHWLTRDVAYETLLLDQRREAHAAVVAALERRDPSRGASDVEALAHHAWHGELWAQAADYSRAAAARASARFANREAVTHLERALAALSHSPRGGATTEQEIDLRLAVRSSLVPLGEFARVMGFLREAEALAIELDDQRRLGQVCGATAQTASWLGEHDRAIAYGRRALEIGVNLDDRAIVTIARCRLGHLFATLGSYREAVRILQEVVSGVDEPATTQHFGMTGLPAVVAHTFLAWAHAELGEFEAGEANAAEAFRIAAKHASAFDRVNAAFGFGMLRIRRGQPEAAVPSLTDAMRLCQLAETRAQLPSIAMSLGLAQSLAGRHSDALPLLERASEEHSALGVTGSRSLFLASLAEGCMRAGHTARALGLANDAVELAHHLGERSYEALARWVRAEAAAQSAYEPLTAASDYAAAERLARDLALRPLLGRCLLGRGRLYRRLDRMDEGDAALSEAERLFIALGMTADHLEAARALGRSR